MHKNEFVELNAFEAVARHLSFARAAAELGVTAAALSQTVRRLEARLSTRLLNRTTRSVALTDAGRRLLIKVAPALGDLTAALVEAAESETDVKGTIRVSAPRSAAALILEPAIAGFHRAYPDVVLEIVVDEALVDTVADGFDAGIRLGDQVHRDMVAISIGPNERQIVVASPDYLAKRGRPNEPHDLVGHACINWRHSTTGAPYRWEFIREEHIFEVAVSGPLLSPDPILRLHAALEALGIAYVMERRAVSWLQRGDLVGLLSNWCPQWPGFYLYFPDVHHIRPPLRAFADYLRSSQGCHETEVL
ncbi:LysR family transcriptional regulator [Paraburkholderia sp. 22B1P]|uniref:LysR family transcriptional regulator n=1 Tax=Paraburkholderia sp. 22B1P TaxID=3080498 RepID=UPI00308FAFE8|nr:LysR family transcriptional regulator [Paraburkholderia sp. 22B1P]